MQQFQSLIQRFRAYDQMADIGEIARRYFAMNAFDGVLTIIGVLMGNMTAGVDQPHIVIKTGLAISIAMGVSGLWGTYMIEAAERKRDLAELNRYTLRDLSATRIGQASRVAVVAIALVDGFSPFLVVLIVLTPFFVVDIFPSFLGAYYTALGLALLTLFGLGLFLGHISRNNLWLYGLKTVVAGLISIGISFLLEG